MSEQGSDDWLKARCGKVTASRISDMLAKTKNGWGASRANYAAELVAERLTGVPTPQFVSPAMRRGSELEGDAADAYEFRTGLTLETVGFVTHPTIVLSGASPDRLVGNDGLAEFKVPNVATHIATLLSKTVPGEYNLQMQWQMACTPRSWCDWVSYCPELPPRMQLFIKRVPRDPALIGMIERETQVFLAEIAKTVSALEQDYPQNV